MKKDILLAFTLTLLLTSLIVGFVRSIASHSEEETRLLAQVDLPVHNIDSGKNFPTIQGAINNNETLDGHTILVDAGVYYEDVVVNKSISLVGESRSTTIVDGNRTGTVIEITADNVVISGFTVQNSNQSAGTSHAGIKISGRECNVTDNSVTRNKIGIFVTSQKIRIVENIVKNNGQGIALYASSEVTVEANNVSVNTVGISLAYSSRNMIVGNRVVNSSEGGHGVTLSSVSFNNTILDNYLVNNYHGIWFSSVFDNLIIKNTVANNELLGIELASSPDNTFYHNNFVNNPKHVVIDSESISIWDDSYLSGGNYWSDYNGTDLFHGPNQNITGSDGVGDSPLVIGSKNNDSYPLMGPITFFDAGTWNEVTYFVQTVSNSTVSDFNLSVVHMMISFNVTGSDGTIGFSRVGIPKELLYSPNPMNWVVQVNGTLVPFRVLEEVGGNYTYLYFTYSHSTQKVEITGTEVIPEFPTWTPMLLILIVLTVATAIYKRRLLKTPIH